jgi:hypothetical protein
MITVHTFQTKEEADSFASQSKADGKRTELQVRGSEYIVVVWSAPDV